MGALRPGEVLSGTSYQIVRELGAGGMGVVYEIEHVRLKKRYVAKVLHEQIQNDADAARRMEREAQVLASISHPNIVQVHDVGTTPEGVSYFVMEKLEGTDLRNLMKADGPTEERALEIVADVLDALAHVHQRGIVHRDIKPENIFLAEQLHETVTKVLDFGIVHIFDSDGRVSHGRITKTGGFVGTLYYAAPEQMQGTAVGPPSDVYASGLVLFEMLAGKGPFDDDPGVGLSRCFKPAPLLRDVAPRIPRALSDIVARALEQDPARRPTAGALAAELRQAGRRVRRSLPAIGPDDSTRRSVPEVEHDDPIRAEVDDLLRRMAPITDPPRKASTRGSMPEQEETRGANATPETARMGSAGLPGVSAEGADAMAPGAAQPDAGAPLIAGAATHVGVGPPITPRMAQAKAAGSSGGPGSTAPPSPRASSGPERPTDVRQKAGAAPAGHLARQESTSPGLYATVDGQPLPVVAPRTQTRWRTFAGASAAVVIGLVVTGTLAFRNKTRADSPGVQAVAPPPASSPIDGPFAPAGSATGSVPAAPASASAAAASAHPATSASTPSDAVPPSPGAAPRKRE